MRGRSILHGGSILNWGFGGTALYRYEQVYPRIDVGEQRAKCAYCGQWGEQRSQCKHCGAPVDGERIPFFDLEHEDL